MSDGANTTIQSKIGDAYEEFARKWVPADSQQRTEFLKDSMAMIMAVCRETSNAILGIKS